MIRQLSLTVTLLFSSFLACYSSAANISAENSPGQTDTGASENSMIAVDSLFAEQTAVNKSFAEEEKETSDNARLVIIDDERYILNNGTAYPIEDLSSQFPWGGDDISDDSREDLIPVIAICFIVPCLTIIIALVLLLMFFMRRTQAKNRIIEHAIDANYHLPDAFYTNQTSSIPYNYECDPSGEDTQNNENSIRGSHMTHQLRRDPKKFSSAVTLIAVGTAILVFLGLNSRWSVAFLVGGFPLFLGIGNLIGYFYIPGYSDENTRKRNEYRHNRYPGTSYQPDASQQQYHGHGVPGSPYNGSYPPPFNPDDKH